MDIYKGVEKNTSLGCKCLQIKKGEDNANAASAALGDIPHKIISTPGMTFAYFADGQEREAKTALAGMTC